MDHIQSLLIIAALYLATKASPGPVFFLLSRYAMAGSKRTAVLIALGITAGSLVWASRVRTILAATFALEARRQRERNVCGLHLGHNRQALCGAPHWTEKRDVRLRPRWLRTGS